MKEEELHFLIFAALLAPPGLLIFGRMLLRIRANGGRVLTERFGIPDLFMGFFLAGFFALGAMLSPPQSGPMPAASIMKVEEIINGAVSSLIMLSIVVGFLWAREISPTELFGIRKLSFWRAALIGVLLVAAMFPILMLSTVLTQMGMRGEAREQEVVQFFREAAGANQPLSIAAMYVMAVIVAPVVEEVIFRGYFYAVFKKWAGGFASLIFTAALFAVVHTNVAVLPSLMILAVGLTLAYEWSGSILVPIAMHATFNGMQLGMILMATSQQQVPS